jgi:hypothetical protein
VPKFIKKVTGLHNHRTAITVQQSPYSNHRTAITVQQSPYSNPMDTRFGTPSLRRCIEREIHWMVWSNVFLNVEKISPGRDRSYLIYKTFIVCNNCTELSQRSISLYNAGAEKFKNTCNKGDRKRNLNIITARNKVPKRKQRLIMLVEICTWAALLAWRCGVHLQSPP